MGGVSEAIAKSARSFGAEIRTNAKVSRVLTRGGQVRGAVLENGEELTAPLVVTTLHPKIAFLEHLSPTELPDDFVGDIEHFKTRSGVVKINVALSELPSFTANPSFGMAEHLTGSIEMASSIEYLEAAFQEARAGKPAAAFSDGVIPTTLDKTLNPDGTHIMSLFTQWCPAEWADAPHTEELDAYADRVIDTYDQVAPGFKASITHRDVGGRHEMQEEYGLIGGNIFHGELSLEQLLHMCRRPVTPTTAPRSPACTTAVPARMPAVASAAFPVGRRAARRSRTRRRACGGSAALDELTRGRRSDARRTVDGAGGRQPRPDSFGSRMVLEAQRGSARFQLVNPRYDHIGALADVIAAFSDMATELGDVVDAVEANPVATPHGVIAVDAVVQASGAES